MNQKDLITEQKVLDRTIEKIKKIISSLGRQIHKKSYHFKSKYNLPGDEIALRRNKLDANSLRAALRDPYFGKIEIHSNSEGNEAFYIGKQGVMDEHNNILILDWRMPQAEVYYNFTPGQPKQNFTVELDKNKKEVLSVDVLKKMEFIIKNQKITKIIQQVAEVESDRNVTITESGDQITITDDFLSDIIANSETTGYLKEIIATIQREQNIAIRQPLNKNVIIQGVAGSGKSSIALHRLAFLLFNNKRLDPKKFLILGPSNLFISSVKGLLPELNLEGIKQATVQQFIIDIIQPVIKREFHNPYPNYFENILFKNRNINERQIIEFKGSESLAFVLDIFVGETINNYQNNIKSITLFDKTLTKEQLIEIYNSYGHLSFGKKIERFYNYVENYFTDVLDMKIKEQESLIAPVKDIFIKSSGISRNEKRDALNILEKAITHKNIEMQKEFNKAKKTWKEQLKSPDILTLYEQALSYEVLKVLENEIGSEIPSIFKNYHLEQLTYFDLAPLLYIYILMYGKPVKYAHIVIDEVQDLSYLHFETLKRLTNTMTILGDKDQSIFMDYGQYDWNNLMGSIFENNTYTYLKLETSYRSTKEIIEVANNVLSNQQGVFHTPITALNRKGEKVDFQQVQTGTDLLKNLSITLRKWQKKYKRIAIIQKDEEKSEILTKHLNDKYSDLDIKYIGLDQDLTDQPISVISSYNSKGMEFDAVILVNVNAENFPMDELHARLLYVMLTRAQQEIKIFYRDIPSPLLVGIVEQVPETVSVYDDVF